MGQIREPGDRQGRSQSHGVNSKRGLFALFCVPGNCLRDTGGTDDFQSLGEHLIGVQRTGI